jgi:hypothetical protein
MSTAHFQALQQMIEELERFGFVDITEQVKPLYEPYLCLCTLSRPADKEGSVSIETVDELLTLPEEVDPSRLSQQVWFCEACQDAVCNRLSHARAKLRACTELAGSR